ncbi:hypothetical protein BgiBS90_015178 [Biomphalaria glabrata]|nr:hypothetical protein BgiBS90_015178 [Biomphalaria glabrata]
MVSEMCSPYNRHRSWATHWLEFKSSWLNNERATQLYDLQSLLTRNQSKSEDINTYVTDLRKMARKNLRFDQRKEKKYLIRERVVIAVRCNNLRRKPLQDNNLNHEKLCNRIHELIKGKCPT